MRRIWSVHLILLGALLSLNWLLGAYEQGVFARVMVLATYATGYNILFGYTGLLSLGHAMFFAAGMYGLGIPMQHFGVAAPFAFVIALACGAALGLVTGLLALRTTGVAFMIVTLMFAQSLFLAILYFSDWTRGDEGFVIAAASRNLFGLSLAAPDVRYLAAFALFAAVTLLTLGLVQTRPGRALIAIRENEARAALLGYDTWRLKLGACVLSATVSAAAGAAYALLFGNTGSTFAGVEYSILPLLWVLLGGAGTIVGPFIGTLFMVYLIDWASDFTNAYMLVAGAALVALTLFAPGGIAGLIRSRLWRALP